MRCVGPAATQVRWDSYPATTASRPRCKQYLGDLRPKPMKRPTPAGIKDMTSSLLDDTVEFGDFKTEWGIVLRPGTVLLIFLYFTPCLTFSLRLMVTHSFVSCDHLLYRLVTRYVPVSIVVVTSIVPCDLLSHVDGL